MTGPVTAEDVALIDGIEALLAEATTGPWDKDAYDDCIVGPHEAANVVCAEPGPACRASSVRWIKNANAIVALHNAAPRLIALARLATRTEPPARGEDVAWEADARTVEMCAEVADRHCVGLRGLNPRGWAQINTARDLAEAIRALTHPSAKGDGR